MLEKLVRDYTPGGLHPSVEGGKRPGARHLKLRTESTEVQTFSFNTSVFTIKVGVFMPSTGNRTPVMYPQKRAYCSHFAYDKPP